METQLKLDIGDVQEYLRKSGVDGWLIYDFVGLNKVAQELFVFTGHLITRRWFYFIPAYGEPTALVHRIERANFPKAPGEVMLYSGWQELHASLNTILQGAHRIAMEYSPRNAIPTNSFVDAGTFEVVSEYVDEIVSSANLVQYFTCRLSQEQLESHKRAARVLDEAQQKAFQFIEERLRQGKTVTEFEVQQLIMHHIHENGMTAMAEAIVAVNEFASDPHYAPTQDKTNEIQKGDCILIDLWGKETHANGIYADITLVGFAGAAPPEKYMEIWTIARDARNLAVDFMRERHQKGLTIRGYEVDEVVRKYISDRGYGEYFFHRTGHSIDQSDHGKAVNIDSFETRDLRELMPGLLFSIEPGIYLPEFGVRTEIDVYFGENGPEVYTPIQEELILMDV